MRYVVLSVIAGCGFSKSAATPPTDTMPLGDAEVIDEMVLPPDAPDDKCFGNGSYYVCVTGGVPTGSTALPDGAIDTTACSGTNFEKAMMGGVQVCVVKGDTVALASGANTGVVGELPLVIVAVSAITISGTLDVASVRGNTGPNANAAQCTTTGIDGSNANGGGGAGGSFGSTGGDGGNGTNTANSKGVAAAALQAPSLVLRGGCRGGTGGGGTAATAGPGGGAVYLVSRGTITVAGIIDASGGGGAGGNASKGGGAGGGSGGMIVFHAGTLTITAQAKINANGGGGGAGAGNVESGGAGQEPNQTTPLVPALGSQDSTSGRVPGGNGAGGATGATAGPNSSNGGGGGGGGFGQIRVLRGGTAAAFPAGTVSPIPSG